MCWLARQKRAVGTALGSRAMMAFIVREAREAWAGEDEAA